MVHVGVGVVGLALVVAAVASRLTRPSSAPAQVSMRGPGRFAETFEASSFQKGNLHTHTNLSDGDTAPAEVYAWYREHGYAFLAITDHNSLTEPPPGAAQPGFAVITGEEITMSVHGVPVHVNALCTKRSIGGRHFDDKASALRWAVAEVLAQGGVALVNHPNFEWALTPADVVTARGAHLLEIWSGHPHVRSEGDLAHPSPEVIWDAVLGAGATFAPAAVDDMHYLSPSVPDPAARPGRAWVQVFAAAPEPAAICAALGAGRLYSSGGAELRAVSVSEKSFVVIPATPGALVEFIGAGGVVLSSIRPSEAATYTLHGGESYVRARITDLNGKKAWTAAYRVEHADLREGALGPRGP
jgi:hypothetical protein